MAAASTSQRGPAGHFIRWASNQKLTSLDFPATRWAGPTRVIDAEGRWAQARRLLHDGTLKPEDRVAGLLVLLYAQQPATISRLTLGHVQASGGEVRLRLGREPVVLPEPLAGLVLHLAATRQGHATIGDQGTSPWLLPGGRPGQPISPYRLSERLHQIGIHPGPARSTALFQLATELPAAILARMLGIHIDVAVAWQRASAGDWMTYAADVSRRDSRARTCSVTSRNTGPDLNPAARCPACGSLLPGRDPQRGGRKGRYCCGACKAKAYRDRQRSGTRAGDAEPPLPPPHRLGTHARPRSAGRSAS